MKALFLYSDKSGKNKSIKLHKKIADVLSTKYEVTSKQCVSINELMFEAKNCSKNYDVLIVAGGDGTLNAVVNAIAPLPKEERPTIGYIPTGTINDAGKSYGIKHSVKQALKIILAGHVVESDIGLFNDSYFLYVLAIGQYSDISYITPRIKKKRFGRLAYYFIALKEAFQRKRIHASIVADGNKADVITPFVLIMNGVNVGGFPINFSNSTTDGMFDIYLTKPGWFNGLLHYLFFKMKTRHLRANQISIATDSNMPWCVDGEKGTSGSLSIKCLPKHISIFGK